MANDSQVEKLIEQLLKLAHGISFIVRQPRAAATIRAKQRSLPNKATNDDQSQKNRGQSRPILLVGAGSLS